MRPPRRRGHDDALDDARDVHGRVWDIYSAGAPGISDAGVALWISGLELGLELRDVPEGELLLLVFRRLRFVAWLPFALADLRTAIRGEAVVDV